jgi:hypothetical protein
MRPFPLITYRDRHTKCPETDRDKTVPYSHISQCAVRAWGEATHTSNQQALINARKKKEKEKGAPRTVRLFPFQDM